jgi:glycosyltransferase involved in cell wall biosynthesis
MISEYVNGCRETIHKQGLMAFFDKIFNSIKLPIYDNMFRAQVMHGFFIKNRIERKANQKLLARAEINSKHNKNQRPLVSVIIPTYNRASVLTERTIPSVLKQTYQNFELIIIGDKCTDNTEELIKEKFCDRRIRFINLQKRSRYPKNPHLRWLVAGGIPRNEGLRLARGEWIAPLDDDDEFSKDHLEVLLNYAVKTGCELVYGATLMEKTPGKWVRVGSYPLTNGSICHLSAMYSSTLKFFKYDHNAWKYLEPNDANLWRRMQEAGVRIGFIDRIIGKHYEEKSTCREKKNFAELQFFFENPIDIKTHQKTNKNGVLDNNKKQQNS